MFDAILNIFQSQDQIDRREGKKWAKRVNQYFWSGFEMTEFAKEELPLETSSHVLCGYICGFMDVLFQHIGQPQGSARAAYAVQVLIAEEMPEKQAAWLREVLHFEAYNNRPSAVFNGGRLTGATDANAYLAREQEFSFGRFLFREFRNLCRCTHPQLMKQLSTPR
jgi:hypothetical protein